MANQKKKLSLKEFYEDSTLGDNWADDDIDLSSISVPVISQRHSHHDYLHYQSNSHQTFSSNYGSHTGFPKSPPYIAKFTNIPSHFGVKDIEDLFRSRFMKFLKMKLFWELNHDLLQSRSEPSQLINKRKKVAFVELNTLQEFEKVLKWNDLYLGAGMGKVLVDIGNFGDFKTYNDLNQKVSESDDPSLPSIPKRDNPRRYSNEEKLGPQPSNGFINNYRQPPQPPHSRFYHKSPELTHSSLHSNNVPTHVPTPLLPQQQHTELPPLQELKPAPQLVKKSNPFGSAKPVDILSKQLEIEKKLRDLQINQTTYRTLGHDYEEKEGLSRIDENPRETSTVNSERESTAHTPKESIATPPVRSKQSTPSHHHLKLSQPSSPKKSELRPASRPEVEAWKPLNLNSNTSMISPPSQPAQLHPLNSIPTVSADVFKGKKKPSQQQGDSTDDIPRRKVLLKRKEVDHTMRNAETGRIVRRDSNVEKEKPEYLKQVIEESEKKERKISKEEAIKPTLKNRRSTKPQNDISSSSNLGLEKNQTTARLPENPTASLLKDIPRPEPTIDRFGRKVFHNASYVKNSNKSTEPREEQVFHVEEDVAEEESTATEPSTEPETQIAENQDISSFRGRGRGRGRGTRGIRGGRGRGRGGVSSRLRREGSGGSGSNSTSRSKSPVKKSQEVTEAAKSETKPENLIESRPGLEIEATSSTKEHTTKPRPSRGRGGYKGPRGKRGRGGGLYHNVSRTFKHSEDKSTPPSTKDLTTATEKP